MTVNDLAPEYVAARRVLLDALTALDGHLDNLVLVGAQAVYHHSGSADLNVPLMTTDADLAVNTHELADAPEIGGLMRAAGFTPGPNPGHWLAMNGVSVDLMVVPYQAGTTKASARAARIAPHEKLTGSLIASRRKMPWTCSECSKPLRSPTSCVDSRSTGRTTMPPPRPTRRSASSTSTGRLRKGCSRSSLPLLPRAIQSSLRPLPPSRTTCSPL
ncbi:hypothetical protein [Saccharopolyspora terrae]|uniref:hypothetical protein n=1 Tax=Saccharopolyspora terrae TaxID=2530384 RepID=UPI001A9F62F2|nr:hypothetical protein [Saccharopolyspora terrae]